MTIPFVNPCFHKKPIPVSNLDEITIEERDGAWWIKDDAAEMTTKRKPTHKQKFEKFKQQVFDASVRQARKTVSDEIKNLKSKLQPANPRV